MGCEAQLALKMLIFTPTLWRAILTGKNAVHTDLVSVCDERSLVGLCVCKITSLRTAVIRFM